MGIPVAIDNLLAGPATATQSTSNIVVAVELTGDDNESTKNRPTTITGGDFSAFPFRTFEAAKNALPGRLLHDLDINAGPGAFTGVEFNAFVIGIGNSLAIGAAQFRINGTRANFTPVTGPQTGTFTSGAARSATLTGAGWTDDNLQRKQLNVVSGTGAGQILAISENSAEVVSFATLPSPALDATSVFSIEEPATVIDTATPSGGCFVFQSCYGSVTISDVKYAAGSFGVAAFVGAGFLRLERNDFSSSFFGFFGIDVGTLNLDQCVSSTAGDTVSLQGSSNTIISGLVDMSTSGRSVFASRVDSAQLDGCFVKGSKTKAIEITFCRLAKLDNVLVDGPAVGLAFAQVANVELVGDSDVSNCTAEPMALESAVVEVSSSLSGVGNAGFGVRANEVGTLVVLSGLPTITGGLGDSKVDGIGVTDGTDLPWVATFAAIPSSAVNSDTGSRIVRPAI